jgi:hypothetical protein
MPVFFIKCYGIANTLHPIIDANTFLNPGRDKPTLMLSKHSLVRLVTILFIVGIGYALAKAFYYGSFLGIVLAVISLAAAIYIMYILAEAKKEMQKDGPVWP